VRLSKIVLIFENGERIEVEAKYLDIVKVFRHGNSNVVSLKTIPLNKHVRRYVVVPERIECFESVD